MRIISQNVMIDVPYEMVALHECAGRIRMNMAGDTGKGTVLAEYSTKAKAKRAMEMLHEKYLETSRGCSEYAYTEFELPRVFQFPTDEEVEDKFET